jgi:hypothetical protein
MFLGCSHGVVPVGNTHVPCHSSAEGGCTEGEGEHVNIFHEGVGRRVSAEQDVLHGVSFPFWVSCQSPAVKTSNPKTPTQSCQEQTLESPSHSLPSTHNKPSSGRHKPAHLTHLNIEIVPMPSHTPSPVTCAWGAPRDSHSSIRLNCVLVIAYVLCSWQPSI